MFTGRKLNNPLTGDPVADLQRGWDGWIGFALARPRLFRLMTQMPPAARDAVGWHTGQDGSVHGLPKLDLDVYPNLPKANVGTTSAASYMSLMKRGQAA